MLWFEYRKLASAVFGLGLDERFGAFSATQYRLSIVGNNCVWVRVALETEPAR